MEIFEVKDPLFEYFEEVPSICGVAYRRKETAPTIESEEPTTEEFDMLDFIYNTPIDLDI